MAEEDGDQRRSRPDRVESPKSNKPMAPHGRTHHAEVANLAYDLGPTGEIPAPRTSRQLVESLDLTLPLLNATGAQPGVQLQPTA